MNAVVVVVTSLSLTVIQYKKLILGASDCKGGGGSRIVVDIEVVVTSASNGL